MLCYIWFRPQIYNKITTYLLHNTFFLLYQGQNATEGKHTRQRRK